MTCVIYRPGTSHEVNGVKCEVARVEPEYLQSNLDAGWYVDVKDFPKEVKSAKSKKVADDGEQG